MLFENTWKLIAVAPIALMMSACSSAPGRLPIQIDASLMQPCPEWAEPYAGQSAVEYAYDRRGQYMRCAESKAGLIDAAREALRYR